MYPVKATNRYWATVLDIPHEHSVEPKPKDVIPAMESQILMKEFNATEPSPSSTHQAVLLSLNRGSSHLDVQIQSAEKEGRIPTLPSTNMKPNLEVASHKPKKGKPMSVDDYVLHCSRGQW